MKKISIALLFLLVSATFVQAQDDKHTYKPLKLSLNEDGSKYIRFIIWHQLWLSSDNNDANGKGLSMSIRRSRFLAFTQVSPRFLILTHFGLNSLGAGQITANPNSQTANNRSMLFLHDAWGEFAVVDKKFHVGTGLHYWNGISRLSNQSTLNMMTLDNAGSGAADARLFPWSDITTSDQFARHLGIYAKGTIGKFSYRVAANNARINQGDLNPNTYTYQVDGSGENWLYTGYFNYNFFDAESTKLPYFVGTYLGKKKVLSVGAGFLYHPDALARGTSLDASDLEREATTKIGADIFYDAPLGNGAISALAAYYNFNYGGEESLGATPGGGLVPSSGSIFHAQLGYLLPVDVNGTKFMPYVSFSNQDLSHTPNSTTDLSLGLNWFINGHFAKITAEYSTGKSGAEGADTRNIFRLQTHIFL